MGSNKKPKITDYWNAPRGPMDAPLGIARFMSLRRFQSIFTLFTVSLNSVDDPNEVPRAPPTLYHKPRARRVRVSEGTPIAVHPIHW
jgi:hypothetical protein